MNRNTVVVALGGNALEDPRRPGVIDESRIDSTSRVVGSLLKRGYGVVVTHGNGPQVGELQEALLAAGSPLAERLDVLGAMTQGELGHLISKSVRNTTGRGCAVVVTHVLVSEDDPAFTNPTKPIGRYYSAQELAQRGLKPSGFTEKLVDGRRLYRRVVPSPRPLDIVEADAIRALLELGYVVVACGGGGVPVVKRNHAFEGVQAVIDKDLASSLLATLLDATMLIILTAVDSVMLDYGKPTQRTISKLSVAQAKRYLEEGVFDEGTMAPKIRACVEYTSKTGRSSIITSPERLEEALEGKAGTTVTPSPT